MVPIEVVAVTAPFWLVERRPFGRVVMTGEVVVAPPMVSPVVRVFADRGGGEDALREDIEAARRVVVGQECGGGSGAVEGGEAGAADREAARREIDAAREEWK